MAARTPRRTFAHPFVVTLAAVPACVASTSAQPVPAPAPEPAPETSAPPAVTNPPRPTPAPDPLPAPAPEPMQEKPSDTTLRWYVTKSGATCMARVQVDCPQPAKGKAMPTCNPPAARAYACPDGVEDKTSFTVVRYANAVHCVIEAPPMKCPANARCNPPAPRRVTCPK